jgi:hypothetical protein
VQRNSSIYNGVTGYCRAIVVRFFFVVLALHIIILFFLNTGLFIEKE